MHPRELVKMSVNSHPGVLRSPGLSVPDQILFPRFSIYSYLLYCLHGSNIIYDRVSEKGCNHDFFFYQINFCYKVKDLKNNN